MLNEATIHAFLMLAQVGSFTEAGKRLYLSQQAVSKQIAKLEQDLNCVLFQREKGRVVLTEVGKIYFEAFSQATQLIAAARNEADSFIDSKGDTLTIGMPELLELQPLVAKLAKSVQMKYPNVQLNYKIAPHWRIFEWLKDGTVDIAFSFEEEIQQAADLDYKVVGVLNELLVVSENHPKAAENAVYTDFKGETVFYTPTPSEGSQEIVRVLWNMGFPVDRISPTDNFLTSIASVEQGQGVMLVLEHCSLLRREYFKTYPTNQKSTLVLAYRRNNRKRVTRAFYENQELSI